MHMPEIQSVLNEKNISFSYVEEDNCGSIDFEHRGLRYHIWNTLTRRTRSAWRQICGMRDGMKRSKGIMTVCLRSI